MSLFIPISLAKFVLSFATFLMQGVFFAVLAELGYFQFFFCHCFGFFSKVIHLLAHRALHF